MTTNQIAYNRLLEERRNNIAVLDETNRHNVITENESIRHNKASEQLQKYGVDSNLKGTVYSANKHYQASVASASISAAAHRYAAEKSLQAANVSAAASRYVADSNKTANLISSSRSLRASKYSADTSAAASKYNTMYKASNDLMIARERNQTTLQTTANTNATSVLTSGIGTVGRIVGSYSRITKPGGKR